MLYLPSPAPLLEDDADDATITQYSGFQLYNSSHRTVSDILQSVSDNQVKHCTHVEGEVDGTTTVPTDTDKTFPKFINPHLRDAGITPPQLHLIDEHPADGNSRIRIVSPLVSLPDGETVVAFSWIFADIWRSELSWDIAQISLASDLAKVDLLTLRTLSSIVPSPGQVVEVKAGKPLVPLERIIAEFESLISKDDVDEIHDVLPFLRKPEHWIILNATAQHVWPEKMLGNKWRVDFILVDSDGMYTAIEIESPKKRLYKTGKSVDPLSEWTHAEQQVRDYCNFIDSNRDYVERVEELKGIFRPRGLVIIGRRESLTDEAKKKLAERNAEHGRFQTITFDDLLDRTRAVVRRLAAVIASKGP